MPRKLTFRSLLTALTMAVVSLCGGGKALAAQKGTLSVLEAPRATAFGSTARDCIAPVAERRSEAVHVDYIDDDAGLVGADRVALGVSGTPFTESKSDRALGISVDQTRKLCPCIRPPTRGPPSMIAFEKIESTNCA